MISVVMPYWCRQQATDDALALIELEYQSGVDLEVILVDDGSPEPFKNKGWRFPLTIIRLPNKTVAKNPCVPFNVGAKEARGDMLVITNPEILHTVPVFKEMKAELERQGEMGYVLAAAWCEDQKAWHCHSTYSHPDLPSGTGHHFCGMMYRSLWEKIGGFDEAYRDGAAWDDTDLVLKLCEANAKFVIRDDLIVQHPKSGAQSEWPAGAWQRNHDLFASKWRKPPVFACVQVGNYGGCGVQYVNTLFDMVRRNVSGSFRFVCFTDSPEGLHDLIEARPVAGKGWWAKLALFAPEAFDKGDRVVYFDLDTLVVGDISDLAKYRGGFALLRDFYRPDGYGSGVMLWKHGELSHLWFDWVACGKPEVEGGDQAWIERNAKAFLLQDLFPNKFVSYKADCKPYPPQKAAVVCFHGEPKPHNCMQAWVADVWQEGGAQSLDLTVLPNTDDKALLEQIKGNGDKAPWIVRQPAHTGLAVLVGTAPSIVEQMPLIRGLKDAGAVIFGLNNAPKVLAEHGIAADYQVLIDAREHNRVFVETQYAKAYLFASQVHPCLFEATKGRLVYQFHMAIDGIGDLFPDHPMTLVGGGTTVGLSAMALAYTLGYRRMHLFGYDSSHRDGQTHAQAQRRTEQEAWTFDVSVAGRKFRTNAAMAKQAELFPILANQLAELDCEIIVHGDGLLPFIAQQMSTT